MLLEPLRAGACAQLKSRTELRLVEEDLVIELVGCLDKEGCGLSTTPYSSAAVGSTDVSQSPCCSRSAAVRARRSRNFDVAPVRAGLATLARQWLTAKLTRNRRIPCNSHVRSPQSCTLQWKAKQLG